MTVGVHAVLAAVLVLVGWTAFDGVGLIGTVLAAALYGGWLASARGDRASALAVSLGVLVAVVVPLAYLFLTAGGGFFQQ